ncbi:Uncharacterised protein [Bordetella pertussis]|nr:Uncharacterised protein [Bordetella pertussis]
MDDDGRPSDVARSQVPVHSLSRGAPSASRAHLQKSRGF